MAETNPTGGLMDASKEVARRFAANLVQLRKQAGLSQEEVGSLASLHRTAIGLLERGARVPRIDTLVKLAAALTVSPEELLDGIAWRPGHTRAGRFEATASERGKESTEGKDTARSFQPPEPIPSTQSQADES